MRLFYGVCDAKQISETLSGIFRILSGKSPMKMTKQSPLAFMSFDLQGMVESKEAHHRRLASLPIAEKLRMA